MSSSASYGEDDEDEGDARGEGGDNEPEEAGDVNVLSYRE